MLAKAKYMFRIVNGMAPVCLTDLLGSLSNEDGDADDDGKEQ